MSYPPDTSRSCHEADGRSDRSGGSGGATSSSGGGVYGTLCSNLGGKWPIPVSTAATATSGELQHDPSHITSPHERLVSNWKKWSLGLDYLLQDSEGVALFKTYLQYEGCSNLLDFWFACQGFRSKVDPSDYRKITKLIKAIYRTYIRGSASGTVGMTNVTLPGQLTESQTNPNVLQSRTEPIRLRAETKRMISERISRKHSLDQSVFDPAQTEVEHFLRTTAYPAFLKSDVYVDFLQSTIDGSTYKFASSQDTSTRAVPVGWPGVPCSVVVTAGFSGSAVSHPVGGKFLPTLEEDRELRSDELPCYPTQPTRTQAGQTNINAPVACAVSHSRPQFHCLHCSQYHSQGHSVCPPGDRNNPWLTQLPHPVQPGLRPFGPSTNPPGLIASVTTTATTTAAPLTTENLQMTRFYRAELSMQQQAFAAPAGGGSNLVRMMHQPIDIFSRRPYPHGPCDPAAGFPRPVTPYAHTHWADALCPSSAPPSDLRSSSRLPSQPPNPYHISYAPVSARDSERHSLSSEARTDDTHSHTDSSHDGTTTRMWKCSLGYRYPGQMPKTPFGQTHTMSSASPEVLPATSTSAHHPPRYPSTVTTTAGSTSGPAFLSPKSGEDPGHSQTGRMAHRSATTEPFHPIEQSDASKPHGRHARRTMRRCGWRSGERGGRGGTSAGPGDLSSATGATGVNVPSKSVTRSHNLAERDPQAFFRILSDKLQRVLDNQMATERLDQLLTESSPNTGQSAHEPAHVHPPESPHRSGDGPRDVSKTDQSVSALAEAETTATTTTTVASTTTATSVTTAAAESARSQSTVIASALLQRPWADRLLAAARSQQDSTRDNAQAILEDHCSRIWAASADRTPNSSSSSGGGGGGPDESGIAGVSAPATGRESSEFIRLPQPTIAVGPVPFDVSLLGTDQPRALCTSRLTETGSNRAGPIPDPQSHRSPARLESFAMQAPCATGAPLAKPVDSSLSAIKSDSRSDIGSGGPNAEASSKSSSGSGCGSGSSPSSTELGHGRASEVAELSALLSLSFPLSTSNSGPGQSASTTISHLSGDVISHPPIVAVATTTSTTTTVSTTQHSTSSSITSAISTSTPGLPASSPSSNSSPNSLVIGYYLGDDPVPYRSLWPASEITLGQFKQLIPKKKGSFRYFFKIFSNEFGSGVVHQEITNDNCVLPLWEGKVVAKVERIE